jgi:membrane protein DedA with SNARE-associated domain/rhodanese-related sulfurtransferase
MELPMHILLTYGYLLLCGWVLVEQLGIPLPATPVLLAAGALSSQGELLFSAALGAAVAGALAADSTWFLVSRRYGHRMMQTLCRLSLEPTSCVRKAQNSMRRRGGTMLLFAKFVPGLATLAAPVAAKNGMGYGAFLLFDCLGAALWSGTLLLCGRFFGVALERNPHVLAWVGRSSGALLVLGIVGFFVARVIRRRAILKRLAAARLEPDELKRQIDAGEPVYIVDLRHPVELIPEPFTLPGALRFAPGDLAARHQEIPRDRDVVLFCSCPSETTAAMTALKLVRLGVERVRPLRGGYDEWKRRGFPLDAVPPGSLIETVTPAIR